jgi:hypothetical protein
MIASVIEVTVLTAVCSDEWKLKAAIHGRTLYKS